MKHSQCSNCGHKNPDENHKKWCKKMPDPVDVPLMLEHHSPGKISVMRNVPLKFIQNEFAPAAGIDLEYYRDLRVNQYNRVGEWGEALCTCGVRLCTGPDDVPPYVPNQLYHVSIGCRTINMGTEKIPLIALGPFLGEPDVVCVLCVHDRFSHGLSTAESKRLLEAILEAVDSASRLNPGEIVQIAQIMHVIPLRGPEPTPLPESIHT